MKPYLMGLCAVIFLLVSSCRKSDLPLPDPGEKSTEQISVSPSFNWKTTQHLDVNLASPLSGVVFILSSDGKKCYHKGFLSNKTDYNTKLSIPSYEEEVQLMLNGIRYTYKIAGNRIDHQFK